MADHLEIDPDELRRAAREHRVIADELSAVPANNADIMATLQSLGPVFGELRDAGRDLLEQRRICYDRQAAAHTALADTLDVVAAQWEHYDRDAAQRLGRDRP